MVTAGPNLMLGWRTPSLPADSPARALGWFEKSVSKGLRGRQDCARSLRRCLSWHLLAKALGRAGRGLQVCPSTFLLRPEGLSWPLSPPRSHVAVISPRSKCSLPAERREKKKCMQITRKKIKLLLVTCCGVSFRRFF